VAWGVKVTEEYAAWFTALIKDDLAYRENIPIAEQLYLDYTTEEEE
jgi:hypothetical protein